VCYLGCFEWSWYISFFKVLGLFGKKNDIILYVIIVKMFKVGCSLNVGWCVLL